jgi:Spy/CpxP family protein refolding chaperone
MKKLAQITLAAAIVAMAVSPALAQQRQRQRPGGGFGGFGGGALSLLTQKSVQDELKLSDEQVKQAKELQEKQRADRPNFQGGDREEIRKKMAERRKAENEAVAKILKPEQLKRVKQIELQQPGALNNEEVAKALKITDEQKGKMREIQMKAFEEMRDLGRDEEARTKRQALMKKTSEKVKGVLTDEQKAKLKEMQGPEFTGKIEPRQGGRRRNQN